jgi:hypothetical protein
MISMFSKDALLMIRLSRLLSNLILFASTLLTLVVDALRFLRLCLCSPTGALKSGGDEVTDEKANRAMTGMQLARLGLTDDCVLVLWGGGAVMPPPAYRPAVGKGRAGDVETVQMLVTPGKQDLQDGMELRQDGMAMD